MLFTIEDIIEEARSAWIESQPGFITDVEALRWFNMGQADFVRKTKCNRETWSLSTVADTQEYAFPTANRVMEILWMTVGGEPIYPVTKEELDAYSRTWRQAAGGPTGEPEWYYITGVVGAELGLYYCPDAVYTVTVYYVKDPTIETEPSGNPEIPDTWQDALIYYIEWKGHRKNRNWQAAKDAKAEYDRMVFDAAANLQSLQPERIVIMSGPEYRGGTRKLGWPRFPANYGREF